MALLQAKYKGESNFLKGVISKLGFSQIFNIKVLYYSFVREDSTEHSCTILSETVKDTVPKGCGLTPSGSSAPHSHLLAHPNGVVERIGRVKLRKDAC